MQKIEQKMESKFGSACNSVTGANKDNSYFIEHMNNKKHISGTLKADSNQLASQKKQSKENMGSNLSINSILSNSDAATSTIINDDEEEESENGGEKNNSYIVDYYQRLPGKATANKCRNLLLLLLLIN